MATYKDLSEADKIQAIKDEFVILLEDMAKDVKKLDTWLPTLTKGEAEDISKRESQRDNVKTFVSKLQKKKGCFCGECLDIDISKNPISDDLEFLIEIARKEAETKSY